MIQHQKQTTRRLFPSFCMIVGGASTKKRKAGTEKISTWTQVISPRVRISYISTKTVRSRNARWSSGIEGTVNAFTDHSAGRNAAYCNVLRNGLCRWVEARYL